MAKNIFLKIEKKSFDIKPHKVGILFKILRDQSFTSLKEDIRQDINGRFAFSRCLNGTFPP